MSTQVATQALTIGLQLRSARVLLELFTAEEAGKEVEEALFVLVLELVALHGYAT